MIIVESKVVYLNNNNLKLGDYNVYNPYSLVRKFSEKELRQEYSRLRSIAMKRLDRLSKTEFNQSATFKNNIQGFPTTRSLKDVKGLAYELSAVSKFVASKYSTVRGHKIAKAEMLKTLKRNYPNITEENYWNFIEFMNYAREKYGSKLYDSEQIAELFNVAQAKQIPQHILLRRMNVFRKHIPEIREIPDFDRQAVGMSRSKFYEKLKF